MKQNITHYDGDCLQKLLDDALHEPLSTQVAEHIADCPACRNRLESLAGEPQWWSHLVSHEYPAEPSSEQYSLG